jgi:hypothetical protein
LPKKKKKKKISVDLWSSTKTKYHLTSRQIEMAKKLGLRPKKFGSLGPTKSLGSSLNRAITKDSRNRRRKIVIV